jgi:hypothetical protein
VATKPELALAALSHQRSAIFADPDTGDIAEDLEILARRLCTLVRSPRGRALYLALLQDGGAAGELSTPPTSRRAAHAVVERGIARGGLPADTDPDLITGTLFGAVILQALFQKEKPSPKFFRRLVAFVLAGARAESKAPRTSPRAGRASL